MSQSSVGSSHNRHERHLMRQRGAGPRNVTATFGFAFNFPTPPPTSSDPMSTEPLAKRRKTILPLDGDVPQTSRVEAVPVVVGKDVTAVDAAPTEPLPKRRETAVVPAINGASLKATDAPAASTAATEVPAIPETTTRPSRARRKAQDPPPARDVSAKPAVGDAGDDSFIALVRPRRTRAMKTIAEPVMVLESENVPKEAITELPAPSGAKSKTRKKPAGTRTAKAKAKAKAAKSSSNATSLPFDAGDATYNVGLQTVAQPTAATMEGPLLIGEEPAALPTKPDNSGPTTSKAKPRKKAAASKTVESLKAASARMKKAGARTATRNDAAPQSLFALDTTADTPTGIGVHAVQDGAVASSHHPPARTKTPFSYAEDLDDWELGLLAKEKSKRRAHAKASGKGVVKSPVNRKRKRATQEPSEELCDDVNREMDRSPARNDPESHERLSKQRRPLRETHANIARQPPASPGKINVEPQKISEADRSFAQHPRPSPPVPEAEGVGTRPSKAVKRRKSAGKADELDWLSAPQETMRQPAEHEASSVAKAKASRKRRKLADIPGMDLDDLVTHIGTFVSR
ncbi:hypothetical protein B0A55_12360 [Friedmanniomyces simplex]|uniref:Uncharacterized protein n=1 Tax=Friedmanniomyces simplex TaxID=329884 RepID=A0A4U0W6C7_9PEZI|nr:hypothetical protein B0A55_12360 [Friedmanniomyces simplex]